MHRSARHLGLPSIPLADAEKICPGLDVSTFPISIKMLDAFGSAADPLPERANASKQVGENAKQIDGTEYNWDFYKSDFNNAASSLGDSSTFAFFVGMAAVIAIYL